MAKVKHNKFTEGLSGKFGNIVFRQMQDGTTVVAAAPDFSNRVFSEGQLANQSRFQRAVAYARAASRTNPIYAQRAAGTTKTAYNLALADWYNPPVIHSVMRKDGGIVVSAFDDVRVAGVLVTIFDEEGNTLEQGQARLIYEGLWEYATATEGKIRVEAKDLAGNVTSQESE